MDGGQGDWIRVSQPYVSANPKAACGFANCNAASGLDQIKLSNRYFNFRTSGGISKSGSGQVVDIHAQQPVIVVPRQLVDDSAVLDLTLADPDLELTRLSARVPQPHMLHVRVKCVQRVVVAWS